MSDFRGWIPKDFRFATEVSAKVGSAKVGHGGTLDPFATGVRSSEPWSVLGSAGYCHWIGVEDTKNLGSAPWKLATINCLQDPGRTLSESFWGRQHQGSSEQFQQDRTFKH